MKKCNAIQYIHSLKRLLGLTVGLLLNKQYHVHIWQILKMFIMDYSTYATLLLHCFCTLSNCTTYFSELPHSIDIDFIAFSMIQISDASNLSKINVDVVSIHIKKKTSMLIISIFKCTVKSGLDIMLKWPNKSISGGNNLSKVS